MTTTNAPSLPVADEEANSAFSHDQGSSDDAGRSASAEGPRKRRKQTHQKTSCEICKARKVKCDRAEPTCSWCAQHDRECVYLERQKPGSRTGPNPELEAKVNRIDALLQALGRRVEEHIVQAQSTVPQAPSPCTTNRTSPHTDTFLHEKERLGPTSFSKDDPAPQARTPAFSVQNPSGYGDNGQGRLQLNDQTSAQAHTNLPTRTDSFNLPHSSSSISGNGKDSSFQPVVTDLPPQDVIYTLVDLYFKHCNTWCPILDRKTTFGIFFGSTSLGESDRILLHAIIATTMRFLKDSRLSPKKTTEIKQAGPTQ